MTLVGPRPEDRLYVDWLDPVHRAVFAARPGITGPAQIAFRHEEAALSAADVDRQYRDEILPAKLRLDLEYLQSQSTRKDLRLLARTIGAVLR
jgi:lipopolysaccharide/colanic/teichoic acid biosynthesis glycosyltransferase